MPGENFNDDIFHSPFWWRKQKWFCIKTTKRSWNPIKFLRPDNTCKNAKLHFTTPHPPVRTSGPSTYNKFPPRPLPTNVAYISVDPLDVLGLKGVGDAKRGDKRVQTWTPKKPALYSKIFPSKDAAPVKVLFVKILLMTLGRGSWGRSWNQL